MPTSRDIRFRHGDIDLAGTLHLPDTPPPHPAVIMIHGSGDADRDSGGFFTPIRERFVADGLAVLSWDKPGNGESTGTWRSRTIPDRADEALAGFGWLRHQEEIAADRIALWGHSQGGWVGPLAAAREPGIAALVIHSGTGLTPFEQDHFGMEHELLRDGASEEDVRDGHAYLDALHAAAHAGMPWEQFDRDIQQPSAGTPGHGYFGAVDARDWDFFVLNASASFDPLETLRAVRCPILAVFGSDDVLVPAERSADLIWETAGTTNPDVTVRTYQGAGHRLRLDTTGTLPDGYLDAMARWLRKRLSG